MRRRWRGTPTHWLVGVILVALGAGMLLACLLPKCVFLIGCIFIGAGLCLVKR